jgi:valyl-tRNA synthetase
MMMMGLELTGKIPFSHVCIHPLVCDEKGKKMSKTKGNVIDPMDVADEYGVDALRFAMAMVATPSQYTSFGLKHVEQARNFMTKIWNAGRFLVMHQITGSQILPPVLHETMNRWMVQRIGLWAQEVEVCLKDYAFHTCAASLYHNIWHSFCDWYIEWVKDHLQTYDADQTKETRQVMGWVFNQILVLLQPFVPFMTQALWAKQNPSSQNLLCEISWPTSGLSGDGLFGQHMQETSALVTLMIDVITAVRSLKTEFHLPFSQRMTLTLSHLTEDQRSFFEEQRFFIMNLLYIEDLMITADSSADTQYDDVQDFSLFVHNVRIAMPLGRWVDVSKEANRMNTRYVKEKAQLDVWQARADDPAFLAKASAQAVETLRTRCRDQEKSLEGLSLYLNFLKKNR